MINCPNCKQEIPDIALFCGHCGHRLKEAVSQPTATIRQPIADSTSQIPQQTSTLKTSEKSLSRWLLILGGGVFFILIACCAIFGFSYLTRSSRSSVAAPTPSPTKEQQVSTPTPKTEHASTPTPEPASKPSNLELLIDEEFMNNSGSTFWEVSNSAFTVTIESGFMVFDLTSAGYKYELGTGTTGDYWVASRAAKLDPDYTSSFGFLFSYGADTFSVIEITSDGSFAVLKKTNDNYDVLQDWTEFPHATLTSYVDFEASCQTGVLSATVNGVNTGDITGSDCDNADVGLFGYAYDGTDTISFDYFQYGKFK